MDSNKTIDEVPSNYFDHLPNHKKDKKYKLDFILLKIIIFILLLIISTFSCMVMHYLWLEAGTGNANYMFFQIILITIFLNLLLIENMKMFSSL